MENYRNFLSIRHDGKGIPYGGIGERRADGDANFGFKDLKGNPELIGSIPEIENDPSLRSLIIKINKRETGLFSVGCVSGDVNEEHGHRRTGYIEFGLNSENSVQDAQNYFPIFYHLDRLLVTQKFSVPVQFEWQLQPAHFIDSKVNGFTCAIFVNTYFTNSKDHAAENWKDALSPLELLLSAVPLQHGEILF